MAQGVHEPFHSHLSVSRDFHLGRFFFSSNLLSPVSLAAFHFFRLHSGQRLGRLNPFDSSKAISASVTRKGFSH
jgi:hypothetical protein